MKQIVIKTQGVTLILLIAILPSCASPGKSAAVGGVAGAGLGAGVGLLADPGPDGSHRIRNVVIGTAVGGALGVGAGLLTSHSLESAHQEGVIQGEKAAQAQASSDMARDPNQAPKLIPAQTEAHWVPDQVKGNTFVPGHFEFLIRSPADWQAGP